MSKRSRRRKRRERAKYIKWNKARAPWMRLLPPGSVVLDEHVPSMSKETWDKVAPLVKSLAESSPCS